MELRPWSDHAINTRKKLLSFNFLDIVLLQVSLGLPLACFSFPFRGASQIAITSNGGSKPLDTEGTCSSRPWDKGKARPQKNFFRPFGPQFGLKIRGGRVAPRAPPLDPPLASFPNLPISFTSSPLPLLMYIVVLVVVPWFFVVVVSLVYGMALWSPCSTLLL